MTGRCWKFGDDVNTDVIIPARYLNMTDPKELGAHCMEDADPSFARKVKPGDILVAGDNFGCGSSREHAPIAIKAAGVSAVIAKSFARIFFRNAINIGLPIFECAQAAQKIAEGHQVAIDLERSTITDATTGDVFRFEPFPKEMREIVAAGGLMNFVKKKAGLS
ncbi:MAG: 3-isopropylmalate dehydratase small subunit [Planctomycetes bacterium]|nr:3-isopropylmalate dehydratase small subunit [Planctomycetota bacterium]